MSSKQKRRQKRLRRQAHRSRIHDFLDSDDWEVASFEITKEALPDPRVDALPDADRERFLDVSEGLYDRPRRLVADIEDLIRRYPHIPKLYNHLAIAYQDAGRRDDADRIFHQTYELFPEYLFGRAAYAQICMRDGETDKVPGIFNNRMTLIHLYPNRKLFHASEVVAFFSIMAEYNSRIGNFAQAQIHLDVLNKVAPNSPAVAQVNSIVNRSRRLGEHAKGLLERHAD